MAKAKEYSLVGRYMNGTTCVGYQLTDMEGGMARKVTREQMAFLVGAGRVVNCTGQINQDDVIIRGKGFDVRSLPVQQASGALKGTSGIGHVRRGTNAADAMSQVLAIGAIVSGRNCVGYVMKNAGGMVRGVSRQEVLKMAQAGRIGNMRVQNYQGKLLLRGNGLDLNTLPKMSVQEAASKGLIPANAVPDTNAAANTRSAMTGGGANGQSEYDIDAPRLNYTQRLELIRGILSVPNNEYSLPALWKFRVMQRSMKGREEEKITLSVQQVRKFRPYCLAEDIEAFLKSKGFLSALCECRVVLLIPHRASGKDARYIIGGGEETPSCIASTVVLINHEDPRHTPYEYTPEHLCKAIDWAFGKVGRRFADKSTWSFEVVQKNPYAGGAESSKYVDWSVRTLVEMAGGRASSITPELVEQKLRDSGLMVGGMHMYATLIIPHVPDVREHASFRISCDANHIPTAISNLVYYITK